MIQLGNFDPSFYTDGSALDNGHDASSCISFNTLSNPYKKQRPSHHLSVDIIKPAGQLCCPADAERGGIDSALTCSQLNGCSLEQIANPF